MALGVTGQRNKDKAGVVTPNPLPIVTSYDILHYESTLNNSEISGKKEGSMVLVTDGQNKGIYVATGSGRADKWIYLHGVTEDDVSRDTVRELDDMVDVELGAAFYLEFDLADDRVHTKVIETPVLLLSGAYGYRCRMTFDFNCRRKANKVGTPEALFEMKLIGETGNEGVHYIIDHGTFTAWSNNAVFGHLDVRNAHTNSIPVRIHMSEGGSNFYNFSFSLEWTATESIAEG